VVRFWALTSILLMLKIFSLINGVKDLAIKIEFEGRIPSFTWDSNKQPRSIPPPNSGIFCLVQFQTGIFFILPFSIASLAMKRVCFVISLIQRLDPVLLMKVRICYFCTKLGRSAEYQRAGETKANRNLHLGSKPSSCVVSRHST